MAFNLDYESDNLYNYIITDEYFATDLFNSLDYVLENLQGKSNYNLLAVVKEPETDCNNIHIPNFEFVGYDLLDKSYDISTFTNCGGFDETFLARDLNQFGLLDDLSKAFTVRNFLLINNPEEYHADCYVFGIWRHIILGRTITTT